MAILLSASLAGAAADSACPVYDNDPPTANLDASGPVAISGNTVVVNGQVFVRSADGWVRQDTPFGEGEVFLDGNILVSGAGVYVRTGNLWSLEAVLRGVHPRYNPMAINGNTIAVGYPDGPWPAIGGR